MNRRSWLQGIAALLSGAPAAPALVAATSPAVVAVLDDAAFQAGLASVYRTIYTMKEFSLPSDFEAMFGKKPSAFAGAPPTF